MNSNWTLMNYRELKKQIKKAVAELSTVLELKGVVANTSELPLTGNKKGDVYIVSEDNTEYLWTSDNASGLITDYEELGPVISGSFLPPVTASDNGKVATVVDGEWTADSNMFLVTVTLNASYTNVADKTFSEITDAINSGRTVICLRSGRYYTYQSLTSSTIYFMSADKTNNLITIDSNNAVAVQNNDFLPSTTYNENGKILISKNGTWQAGNSVYIIECNGNNSPLTASEIRAIAQSGMYPVLHYYSAYWLYALNNNNNAYFTKLLYGSPSDQKFYVNAAFVNSNKGVNLLLDKQVYTINSTGIPESDLAQAVKDKLNKFVVTLTPTAADYSGTMDKTVAEINAAYEAGQHIVFRTMMSATTYMDVDCTARWFGGSTYPSFNGFILSSDNGGTLIFAFTGATDDGTRATYGANIYALTYPSANGVSF